MNKLMRASNSGELHDHVHYVRESCKNGIPCEPCSTIHLIDSDTTHNLGADLRDAQTNCGQQLPFTIVTFKNNWGTGQCKTWLDRQDVCASCRDKAMTRTPLQFTYGVIA